jgi:hypothetical protein
MPVPRIIWNRPLFTAAGGHLGIFITSKRLPYDFLTFLKLRSNMEAWVLKERQ